MVKTQHILLALLLVLSLSGCGQAEQAASRPEQDARAVTGDMALDYAERFTVDYYDDGCAFVTIDGSERYLIVPQDAEAPDGLDADITVLRTPMEHLYVASSSVMDLFGKLDALDAVAATSTKAADWSLPEVLSAMDAGDILYAGKYSAPDFELLLDEGCTLALENTMIYHSPDIMEQLESLGIPVLVERSGYEPHPLGRMEWIKLYGLLTGKEAEAEAFFAEQTEALAGILSGESTGKSVSFFYISTNGYVNVRKPGDYISKMIELAGGRYVPSAGDVEAEDNALSTMNMQAEAFYAAAKDADVLIYNATIVGGMDTKEQLLDKAEWLADFKAVQTGNMWCTEQNMFQESSGVAGMIRDIHAVLSGEADGVDRLTYLHRIK